MWKTTSFWLTALPLSVVALTWTSSRPAQLYQHQCGSFVGRSACRSSIDLPKGSLPLSVRKLGPYTLHFSSSSSEVDGSDGDAPDDNDDRIPTTPPPPPAARASTPSSALPGLTREQKRLDPLLVSLTRMDDETRNAPRTNIPVWGELILDKSLIVFLPVATFAIAGFFLSLYVASNAQDSFVDAWVDAARQQSMSTAAEVDAAGGCRGLCSNQEQDLEGLRAFMESLRK